MKILLNIVIIFSFLLIGCSKNDTSTNSSIEPFIDNSVDKVDLTIQGTVTQFTFEGGGYAIQSDSNKTYDPINLPERFQINGLKVIVEAKLRDDLVSYHMIGPIIEIHCIKQQ